MHHSTWLLLCVLCVRIHKPAGSCSPLPGSSRHPSLPGVVASADDSAELGQESQVSHSRVTVRIHPHSHRSWHNLLLHAARLATGFCSTCRCYLAATAALFRHGHLCI